MKKFAVALCAITVVLLIAGTLRERAEAQADMRVAETSIRISKNSRKENSEKVSDPAYSDEEIELMALVAVAEAEGESELGKRLVVDTVLNRVDSPYFPDTVSDVIWQKSQFESMWNGRKDRCIVTDDIRALVREETENRTNDQVVYFRAQHFSKFGSPLFQEGNHYFSAI